MHSSTKLRFSSEVLKFRGKHSGQPLSSRNRNKIHVNQEALNGLSSNVSQVRKGNHSFEMGRKSHLNVSRQLKDFETSENHKDEPKANGQSTTNRATPVSAVAI